MACEPSGVTRTCSGRAGTGIVATDWPVHRLYRSTTFSVCQTRNIVGFSLELHVNGTWLVTSVSNGPLGKSRNGSVKVKANPGAAVCRACRGSLTTRIPGGDGGPAGAPGEGPPAKPPPPPPKPPVAPAACWPGMVTGTPCVLPLWQLLS